MHQPIRGATLLIWVAACLSASTMSGTALGGCASIREIHVRILNMRPVVDVEINGKPSQLIFDTGGVITTLGAQAALSFGLLQSPTKSDFSSYGRPVEADLGRALTVHFADKNVRDIDILVLRHGGFRVADGFLGQDLLSDYDLDIDMAHGLIRLYAPTGCRDISQTLKTNSTQMITIETSNSADHTRIFGVGRLNGATIRILFDTGTAKSHVTREAAQRAGVIRDAQDGSATPGPSGLDGVPLASWIGPFRLQIGDEDAGTVELPIVDKPHASADMILGMDYFLAHRVFVMQRHSRIIVERNAAAVFVPEAEK